MNWSSGDLAVEEPAGLGVEVVELALEDRDHVPRDVLVDLGIGERPARAAWGHLPCQRPLSCREGTILLKGWCLSRDLDGAAAGAAVHGCGSPHGARLVCGSPPTASRRAARSHPPARCAAAARRGAAVSRHEALERRDDRRRLLGRRRLGAISVSCARRWVSHVLTECDEAELPQQRLRDQAKGDQRPRPSVGTAAIQTRRDPRRETRARSALPASAPAASAAGPAQAHAVGEGAGDGMGDARRRCHEGQHEMRGGGAVRRESEHRDHQGHWITPPPSPRKLETKPTAMLRNTPRPNGSPRTRRRPRSRRSSAARWRARRRAR